MPGPPSSTSVRFDHVPDRTDVELGASALVAVAHGSRDPRSAATVAALVDEVRRQRPGLDVRLSFLDLSAPRLPDVLAAVHADGHRRAVVVPLLLGRAFHADVDVPHAVHRYESRAGRRPGLDVQVADVLAGSGPTPDNRLTNAALLRLAAALHGRPTRVSDPCCRGTGPPHHVSDPFCCGTGLHDPRLGVVLAAAGSSNASANAAVNGVVEGWVRRFGWRAGLAAFAAATGPTVPDAVAELRRRGARRIAVASWFLAPGRLPDRVERAAHDAGAVPAVPLGADPQVAALVLHRYAAALAVTGVRVAG